MRLRTPSREDEAFDGLTAQEIRRIRGAAEASVTPGLEGLAQIVGRRARNSTSASPAPTTKKRGRRA